MIDLVTVGQLTLDDIVFLDNQIQRKVIGGGALYSAVGARLWDSKTAVNSVTGDIFYQKIIKDISKYDINTEGIKAIKGHGIELWILHESNNKKQQILKLCSRKYTELDQLRAEMPEKLTKANAFHIAPQSINGQKKILKSIFNIKKNPIITLDLQADNFINIDHYKNDFPYDKVTVFLPSREEIEIIWQEDDMKKWLKKEAPPELAYIVIKLGEDGSLVYNKKDNLLMKIPIFPTSKIKDTTGAGDAFCGGLLAGIEKNKDIFEAAIMGTVSASFVVEHLGALNTRLPSARELNKRYQYVKAKVEKISF